MPRRVQDIVPSTHRSIRDIPVERGTASVAEESQKVSASSKPRRRANDMRTTRSEKIVESTIIRKIETESTTAPEPEETVQRISVTPPRARKTRGSKRWILILMGIVVCVAGIGYVASVYFSYATFSIAPKTIRISANSTYVSQSTPGKGVLTYELASVKGEVNAIVAATDGAQTSASAKGKVTLYNAFSPQSQRLIAGTRLAPDSGKIYRLTDSVVIPGYSSTGGSITPGTIIANVVADQPGESYNVSRGDSLSEFKIVAYKGTARYDTMYARLSADIVGGFIGTKKTVAPALLESTTADLQKKITASLLSQVKGTVPEGYVMYDTAYVASFSPAIVGGTDPKSATVTVKGTLYAILFKRDELVSRVAGEQAVAVFDGFAYHTVGLEDLEFSIANTKEFVPEKKNTLIIKLKGDAVLVGTIPADELKKKLAGLSLAETASVLREYKPVVEIEKSSGEITPPWSKVPSDPDRITIEVYPVNASETDR